MSELVLFSLLIVLSSFISSLSQVMLKKAAGKEYTSVLKQYTDPLVVTAYVIFFGCTLISLYALKVVPLSLSPLLESTGYIFIAVMSRLFFREKITRRRLAGMALVICGIVLSVIG